MLAPTNLIPLEKHCTINPLKKIIIKDLDLWALTVVGAQLDLIQNNFFRGKDSRMVSGQVMYPSTSYILAIKIMEIVP